MVDRTEEHGGLERNGLRSRLTFLIAARLAVVTLLFGVTLHSSLTSGSNLDSFTPRALLTLVVLTYVASIGWAVLARTSDRLETLAALQIGWDVIAATVLVGVSGGLSSILSFLYGTAILTSAIVLGPVGTRVTSGSAVVLYVLVGLSMRSGLVPIPPDQPAYRYALEADDTVFALVTNLVGLSLVGVLADHLASRLFSAHDEARRATYSAESLARLNDDIIRSLTSGLMTVDSEGYVRSMNPAGLEMFSTREEVVVGMKASKLLPLERDADGTRQQGIGTRPDGSGFPVGFTTNALTIRSGAVTGTVVSFQDLTEIEELRVRHERAERLATLGKLAAGLAHEIRNPLSSISGSVQLIRESTDLGDEDRRLLRIVLNEVERLDDLVTTMLQVGRPRQPTLLQIDLAMIVGDVVAMARRGPTEQAEVRIDYEGPSHPVEATVDADQAKQLVWNLLKNALQFSPRGGVVHIALRETDGERGRAVIEVRDEGQGIAPEARARLFEAFFSSRDHGVGIGLALVKQIVDAHGGEIEVESEPGSGATFRVLLPKDAEARRSVPAQPPAM